MIKVKESLAEIVAKLGTPKVTRVTSVTGVTHCASCGQRLPAQTAAAFKQRAYRERKKARG